MITDTLMATGSWTLRLKDETPLIVRDALDWEQTTAAGFGHLFIFPARVDAASMSSADRLTASRWTGVLLEWQDEFTISGSGPAWWLGDGDGKGDILTTAISGTAASIGTWITAIRPTSLNAGTVTDPGGTVTGNYQYVSRRAALEGICDAFGVEWQVTPGLKLNVGVSTALWSSTPTALVLPKFEGRDSNMAGLDAEGVARSMDLREYANTAYVLGQAAVASSTSASGYLDINGNAVTRAVVVNSSTGAPGTEGTVALAERTLRQTTRRHVVLSSASHDIAGDISTGGYVYVYDPEKGLRDTANEQYFGGQICWPLKMRVMSQTWPIREGYGVWFRDGNGILTDLTDWFVPETGAATVEFGAIQRTLGNTTGLVGSTDTGKLQNEVSYSAWINYTPTITQSGTVTATITRARYRRNGTQVEVHVRVDMTAAGSAGSGVTISLPVTAAYTGNVDIVGVMAVYDASAGQVYSGVARLGSTTTIDSLAHNSGATSIGANPSFALASGDVVSCHINYEAAA